MNKKLHNLYSNECKVTLRLSTKPMQHTNNSLISFVGIYKDTERYKVIVSPTHNDAYMTALHLIDIGDYIDVVGKIKLVAPKIESDMPHHNMLAAQRIIYRTNDFKVVLQSIDD